MSGSLALERTQYAASLYRLLPALYRGRDQKTDRTKPLRIPLARAKRHDQVAPDCDVKKARE